MRKPIAVLINPAAGRGTAAEKLPEMRTIMSRHRIDCDWFTSDRKGDIEHAVADAAGGGARHVIVAGGDGTVHEAVNGILRSSAKVAFSVIPVGTGNDFAKACGVNSKWRYALVELAQKIRGDATARSADAGMMNDRYFANGAGIGFDAKINRIARDIRWQIGDLVYLAAVFRGIRSGILTPTVRIRYGDDHFEGPITMANISNGAWLGGMFHVAPKADIADGLLDLILVAPVSAPRILVMLPRLIRGTHTGAAEVLTKRITYFELQCDEPLPSHLDGEVQALATEFRISILKNALQII